MIWVSSSESPARSMSCHLLLPLLLATGHAERGEEHMSNADADIETTWHESMMMAVGVVENGAFVAFCFLSL